MKFGENLRLLMETHSIAPKQLAKILHISITMLNNYMHCILEPDYDTLKRIAAFFEMRTDDLLDYRGAPDRREHQMEDELLQAFSEMPPEQQRIFLAQGKATAKFCSKQSL